MNYETQIPLLASDNIRPKTQVNVEDQFSDYMRFYLPAFRLALLCACHLSITQPGEFIPPDAFREFQEASAIRTVPLAIVLGISSLVLTLITAIRGLPNVPRSVIWIAVILAAIPWKATPTLLDTTAGQSTIRDRQGCVGHCGPMLWASTRFTHQTSALRRRKFSAGDTHSRSSTTARYFRPLGRIVLL